MAGRVLGAITVAATAGLTLLALAIPASAHTPSSKAECVTDKAVLSVKLASYAKRDNTILVKDGETELLNTKFGENFDKTWSLPGDVDHTFTITVQASDGQQHNYSKTHTVAKCVKTPPSSSSSTTPPSSSESTPPSSTSESVPPTEVTTTTVSSSSETVPPTTTTTPVAGGGGEAQPPLAATGASPGWALLAGLVLVGGGAGAVFMVRRKRAA